MHLNVFQGVLLDVTDTKVGMLLDLPSLRNGFTGQKLNERRLSSTIASNDSHTRRQREGKRGILKGRFAGPRVCVRDVTYTEDSASVRLDATQDTGRRELELHVGSRQSIVALGLGLDLDEAIISVSNNVLT